MIKRSSSFWKKWTFQMTLYQKKQNFSHITDLKCLFEGGRNTNRMVISVSESKRVFSLSAVHYSLLLPLKRQDDKHLDLYILKS